MFMRERYVLVVGLVEGDGAEFGVFESDDGILMNKIERYEVEGGVAFIVTAGVGDFVADDGVGQ